MRTLVTGAAGNIGSGLVRRLLAADVPVRALTRNARTGVFPRQVEVHMGDLDRPETLADALNRVEALFLFPMAETAQELVGLAKRAGVRRIVVLSSAAVTAGIDPGFHLEVERAVEASGLDYTHIRPGDFAVNKSLVWGPMIRNDRVVWDPAPNALSSPIHEQDISDVAFLALTENEHAGNAYTLHGPDLLTRRSQVEQIGAAVGEEIRFDVVTPNEARDIYRAQGGAVALNADFLLGFKDYRGDDADPYEVASFDPASLGPVPTAESVTGKPARTFLRWAGDHVHDFR